MDCQKYFTKLQTMKNTQSKIKPIKTGKEIGTTYCFRYKDFTHNFKLREKSTWRKIKLHCLSIK